jgi:tape measure domain-containing protein
VAEKVGGVYIEIQARMGSLEKDLRTIQARMQQVDNTGAKFSGTMAKLGGVLAGGAIAYGLLNIGKSALSAAANMEKQKVAFTTMLGSAQKAQKLLDEMQAFAASTPFEFNEIVDASKKLISFGVSAEEVQQKLSAIGDVAAGLSIPLGELSEIYGKARVQGTLYAEDLNQLAGRGIPIFEELGKVMNVNAGQVKKLGSEGKISFDMLDQVFKNLTSDGGKFSGLMNAQSQTLSGKWSNFNDQLDKTALLLGDNMSKSAKAITDMMSSALSSFNEWLEKINKHQQDVQNLRDTWEQAAKTNAAASEELEQFIWNISDGLGDATQYIDTMRAQYGDLLTATQVLHAYEMGMVTLSKERVTELQKIVELNNKQTGKDKKDPEKKTTTTTGGGGESPWKKRQKEAENYYKAVEKINTFTDDPIKKVENEITALNEGMNKVSDMYKNGEIKKKQYEDTLASYSEARIKKEEELEQAKFDKIASMYSAAVGVATTFSGQLAQLSQMSASNRTAEIDNELQQQQDALQEKYDADVEAINNSVASQAEKDARLKALDEQKARDDKALATKADKEKRKIAREAAKQQKALSMFDILITTPQAALNAFTGLAKYNIIAAGVAAAAATALGLAQLKLVADQPLPALAEGGIVPAIPGGRTVTVAEAGSSEAVIPLNNQGADFVRNVIGGSPEPQVNLHVYINDDYKGLYKASKDGYVTIDKRAVV